MNEEKIAKRVAQVVEAIDADAITDEQITALSTALGNRFAREINKSVREAVIKMERALKRGLN